VRPPRGRAAPEHGRQQHRNETQALAVNSLNVLRASFNFFADCPAPLLYLMLRVKKTKIVIPVPRNAALRVIMQPRRVVRDRHRAVIFLL